MCRHLVGYLNSVINTLEMCDYITAMLTCSWGSLKEQWLLHVHILNCMNIDMVSWSYLITVLTIGDPDVI